MSHGVADARVLLSWKGALLKWSKLHPVGSDASSCPCGVHMMFGSKYIAQYLVLVFLVSMEIPGGSKKLVIILRFSFVHRI